MERYDSVVHFFVMYTISDERKELRQKFYEKLIEEFSVNPQNDKLNESAYRIRNVERGEAISRLLSIVKDVQNEEHLNTQEDFIDLYCSGIRANYKEKEKDAHDNVIRTAIYPRISI